MLVKEFLQEPSSKNLKTLFLKSQEIAKEQGILPQEMETPIPDGWTWKTMGAGLGDCLWVIPPTKISEGDWNTFSKKLDWSFFQPTN